MSPDPDNKFASLPPLPGKKPDQSAPKATAQVHKGRFDAAPPQPANQLNAVPVQKPTQAPAQPQGQTNTNTQIPISFPSVANLKWMQAYGKYLAAGVAAAVIVWIIARSGTTAGDGGLTTDVLERIESATVLIERMDPNTGKPAFVASGFIIDGGAHIVTNRHAVAAFAEDARSGTVRFSAPSQCTVVFFSGTPQQRPVSVDPGSIAVKPTTQASFTYDDLLKSDLAIINVPASVKSELRLPSLTLGDASRLKETQNVWLCGFPMALAGLNGAPPTPSVQKHDIVNLYRDSSGQPTILQLSGSGTHGNSGGPILTTDGTVVGVFDQRIGSQESLTRAIATQYIQPFVTQLNH